MIIDTETKLRIVTQAIDAMKAEDIVLLDLRGISTFTDHFVLASARSSVQIRAVVREICKRLNSQGVSTPRPDGEGSSHWVVLDLGDVVVHVFDPLTRNHYGLEKLWGDADQRDTADFLTA